MAGKYEPPKVLRLSASVEQCQGDCTPSGSNDAGACWSGWSAHTGCGGGNIATGGYGCNNGPEATGEACTSGAGHSCDSGSSDSS